MSHLALRDIAIAIWELHRERTVEDLNEYRELEKHEQELLLSAAMFARPYIKYKNFGEMVRDLKEAYDPIDYGCESCHYLTKLEGRVNGKG